ncbi:unnamed protein product [Brassicogethes aeneus]|uniref:Histone-lysine N-methyltransferase trithorax n=1 Tax=Brassicogethes aeneus TaxID=1431903 RepID=A0A9P0FMP3_BRAAE|nr:unnamed protein product [Brassicogethes aeneus]
MGRSKFPGKPSKHTNRKRVNVLTPTEDSTANVDSPQELTVENVVENNKEEEQAKNPSESSVNDNVIKTKVSIKRRLNRKMQNSLRNKNASKRNLLSKINAKTKFNSKTKLTRRFQSTSTSSQVGKFILPTRSVHSSRVIKPNKRFIDLNESLTLKKKNNDKEEKEESTEPKTLSSNGRVVLRQARLKLHTQSPVGQEGPFSTNLNLNSGNPPGTVTCGVCGAVRFYRFVKQARKFNIFSCESCRKFISKMIKRSSCGKGISTPLVCLKGQGTCHVPPIVRSQQWKLIRCAYKARCPACWLKLCLRSFEIPINLKHGLSQLLPQNMKGPDIIFNNTLPLIWQTKPETIPQRDLRNRDPNSNKVQTPAPPQPNNTATDIKRQKIDLKGPRVKHVCRSASIVLGQPIAIFGNEEKEKAKTPEPIATEVKIEVKPALPAPPVVEKVTSEVKTTSKCDSNSSETESSDSDKISKIQLYINEVSNLRRERIHKNNSNEAKSMLERKAQSDIQNGISIDFWEGYDPEEICQNGYCLISSEQFPMSSICFLCGSGGRDYLIYCSLCCESYHSFCLEQGSHNIRQTSWLCPKCTLCTECNQNDRQKVNCQKCMKAYHPECFNKKWNSVDQPTVCSKCMHCKSCGSENITKFVGNLPLCITCFKLRKEGKFCPMCQHCYDENECCAKMMECAKCNKWVHSQCEKLTEEQYQILAILPESIEYVCALCSSNKECWRKAIDCELKASFNHVIRLLSKNKMARTTLKWSPLNNHTPLQKSITNVRRLQFDNNDADLDNNNCNKSIMDINKIYSFEENELQMKAESEMNNKVTPTLSMVHIKNKLNSNEYCSVREFNEDMQEALENTHSEELKKIYQNIFHTIFPWHDLGKIDEDIVKKESITTDESHQSVNDENHTQVDFDALDTRMCSFCKVTGDGYSFEESRLLYCGENEWVHANCALWSSEVYEEIDGSLQNVQKALNRGRSIRCSTCKQKGASVGCCYKGCYETYHFKCAQTTTKCQFMHDKTVYCASHELPKNSNPLTTPKDFDIYRSVFVELDKKKRKTCDIDKVTFMVGSLCVKNLGKINPLVSDHPDAIIPMGFVCTRLYWSTVDPWKLVPYIITTSTFSSHCVTGRLVDKNFTVDHGLSKPIVEKMIKELALWQKDVDKKKSDILDYEDDEEPQNGADLLSPELTNAILEELPHDLLDGISVQDIFPASLAFTMDNKLDEELDMDMKGNRELRRSNSEIIPQIKSRSQQRSCSLTLSCKLDSSLTPAIKKRKTRETNIFFQLLQVDGNCDDSSDCESTTGPSVDPWGNLLSEEPVTCEKCQCTYRTQASYKRHLDTCEVLCTSESDSEMDNNSAELMEEPSMVLTSYESYQNEIHTSVLNTQTFVTSKSTELISMPQTQDILKPMIQTVPVNTVAPMTLNQVSETNQYTINHPTITISDNMPSQPAQYCVNPTVPLCVNQPIQIQPNQFNQTISINQQGSIQINQPQTIDYHQPQQVTIQSVPFGNNILSVSPQNQFTLNGKIINPLTMQTVNVPQQWVKPVSKPTVIAQKTLKSRARSRTIAAKRPHYEETDTIMLPQNPSNNQVIVQHLPSTNFVPFVDAFHQQQTGQNVQYVTTIPQTQSLVQLQPDNNLISIVPGLQPTMIIQQPRVLENQLVIDSNGSLGWAPQPVYYGFETIVQNTVMQSQQFLPTTVPGVLTANSSYSTTTQVFQTSKLEPVLDVSSNSFVLMNPGQLVNSQPIEVQQYSQSQPINTVVSNILPPQQQIVKYSNTSQKPSTVTTSATHSITLPTAPFVPEQGIPTNIVIPTPKAPSTQQSRPMSRVLPMPTNNKKEHKKLIVEEAKKQFIEEVKKPIKFEEAKKPAPVKIERYEEPKKQMLVKLDEHKKTTSFSVIEEVKKMAQILDMPKVFDTLIETSKIIEPPVIAKPVIIQPKVVVEPPKPLTVHTVQKPLTMHTVPKPIAIQPAKEVYIEPILPEIKPIVEQIPAAKKSIEPIEKLDDPKSEKSLKLVFQKQAQDGTYKVSNLKPPVQVAPLKPIKNTFSKVLAHRNEEKEDQPPVKPSNGPKKENENSAVVYTIETKDGFKYSSTSVADLWDKVIEAVQAARAAHNMPPLPTSTSSNMGSIQAFGLKTSGLKYLIEQLPGATKCPKYKPTFSFPPHQKELEDDYLTGNTFGAIRCGPTDKKLKEPYDMFGWLSSKHRRPEEASMEGMEILTRRGSVTNLPMAMRFRQLKLTSKYSVGVYRSSIHGRGLFCLRDIEAGEMVIEYAGEVIRSILTDKREKYYNSKGIGCYMFRVDDNFVVDATMKGNAARFINHSCDPNCYSKVVEILGHKHIIIFALRRIISGEELTYDYKFPFEEDKIPCTCGSRRCRKFLN